MLLDLYICDLTQFGGFVYWPVRETKDECIEPIKDGKTEDAKFFCVYGKRYDPGIDNEIEDPVADFSTLQEAASYCLMLNAALQGRAVVFGKPEEKEDDNAEQSGKEPDKAPDAS